MTTEELLKKLPSHIGRNKILDKDGNLIAYASDHKSGSAIGWLYLHNDGRHWLASYGNEGHFVCLNPDGNPPYNNAFAYGDSPNQALQGLYDWCVENNFISKK